MIEDDDKILPPEDEEPDLDATMVDPEGLIDGDASFEDPDATISDPDATIINPADVQTIVEEPQGQPMPKKHDPVAPFDAAEDVDPDAPTVVQDYDSANAATEAMSLSGAPGPSTRKNVGATVPYGEVPGVDNAPELDGFQIIGKLGEGGMGVVWKAVQLSTNREVALKLLPRSAIGSEKAQVRFQREVETAAKVEHPYIAAIYESGIDKGLYFYAMQSIDGEELHDYVKHHKLGEKEILQLMKKVCDGVHYAHLNGIVHRDLKPGNVLVTKNEGEPKILDFGLAKNVTDMDNQVSIAGEVMGTPMYMSTEQAQGNVDDIDGRTDVYSLGVMLFELLTGKFPYETTGGPIEIIRRKFKVPPTRPRVYVPKMDLDLEAVILKAIEPQTSLRYAEADHLSKDIENYLSNRPVTARRHTKGYILSKWLVRNRLGIAALLAVSALSGGIYFGTDLLNKGKVQQAEKKQEELKKTAENATTTAANAIQQQIDQLAENIQTAGKEIDEGKSIAAATLLKEIEEQFAAHREEEQFAGFAPGIATLKTRLSELQQADAARMSGIEKAGQAFADLAQNQVEGVASLNDGLLQQLGFLYQEYKDSGYLEDSSVQAKQGLIAEKVRAIAMPHIESRSDLSQRSDRLAAMRKFTTDPRFNALFAPTADQLGALISEEEKLHVFALVNREVDSNIQITQKATGKTYTVAPDAEEVLPLDHSDAEAFTFTSVRLNTEGQPDPYYLPQPVAVTPTQAGGSIIEIRDHIAKTIPVAFAAEGIVAEHSKLEKGPWQAIDAKTQLVPGGYYARFTRADFKPVIRPFTVKIDQATAIIPSPPGDAWEALDYLKMLAEAKRLADDREFSKALTIVQAIKTDDIESQSTKEKLASYRRELETHPVIVLGNQLPGAQAQVDDFLMSFVQRQDPLSTFFGKPYRYQQGSQVVPAYKLPAIEAGKLGLLDPDDATRYTYLSNWQTAFAGSGTDSRSRAQSFLNGYKSQHPNTLSSEVDVALAMVQWDGKSTPPSSFKSSSYGARWLAHYLYAKGKKSDCEKSLNSLAEYAKQGGIPNSYDCQLAVYAAFYPMDETVATMKKMNADSNQFQVEAKYGSNLATQLEAILKQTPAAAINEAYNRVLAHQKNDKNLPVLMTHALTALDLSDDKRALGKTLHAKAIANSSADKAETKFYLQFAKYFL